MYDIFTILLDGEDNYSKEKSMFQMLYVSQGHLECIDEFHTHLKHPVASDKF